MTKAPARVHVLAITAALALAASSWIGSLAVAPVEAQAPAGGSRGQAPAARGGGPGGFAAPTTLTPYDDYTGFTRIFDGQTFTNWDGERDVWSIVDGMLHADTTKTPGQHHIHYRGPGAVMRDFTLKVEVKLSETGANGGVQYRSRLLHPAHGGSMADPLVTPLPPTVTTMDEAVAAGLTAAPGNRAGGAGRPGGAAAPGARGAMAARGGGASAAPAAPAANPCVGQVGAPPAPAGRGGTGTAAAATGNPWQVSGYQFDLDSNNQYTGQLYEGQGRNIITAPGTIGMLLPGGCKILLGRLPGDAKTAIKPHRGLDGDWQQLEIVVRGNMMVHVLNGEVMSVTIDDDPAARAPQGILSLQLEGSGQIWSRNVFLRVQDHPLEFPR